VIEIRPSPLTVVGAGPAGIEAAHAAADAGVAVTVIDDNPLPGGQYYRQSPAEFEVSDPVAAHSGHLEAAGLYARLDHPNIHLIQNMEAWGVFDGRALALTDHEKTFLLETDRVVLATGAYDRPLAFTGWTLPGVLGAGAALRMIKTQWLAPGKRMLLAGLGPLQLQLADLLLKSGVDVVCVAEATRPITAWRHLPGIWGHWDRLREAYDYRRTLWKHCVPLLFNHAIVSADGSGQVEQATIARLDKQGAVIPGTGQTFQVDTVCLGYGLLPSYQLPAAFGCELRFDDNLSWFVPRHGADMESSEPGIFVAGDVTGMGGAHVAAAEGRVAGLAAAYQLGKLDPSARAKALKPAQAALHRLNRFANALQGICAFRPGLAHLMRDDTVICRCEEVRAREIRDSLSNGAIDPHQVKLQTRTGMGYCQGRICSALTAPIIARETGRPLSAMKPFTTRPPIQPISLGELAASEDRP
jgi:thioredoxin reductase/bacterioferritin-associated ferredoxin